MKEKFLKGKIMHIGVLKNKKKKILSILHRKELKKNQQNFFTINYYNQKLF